MGINFRAIKDSDIKLMTFGENQFANEFAMLRSSDAGTRGNNVVSNSLIEGDHRGHGGHISPDMVKMCDVKELDHYMRVGVLKLSEPVLNPFIAGRSAAVWRSVLNLKKEPIANIVHGLTVFDLVENKEIPTSSIPSDTEYDPERYIFGANYLLYLLDHTDMEGRLRQLLADKYILPALTRNDRIKYNKGELDIGYFFDVNYDCVYPDQADGDKYADVAKFYSIIFANYGIDLDESNVSPESLKRIMESRSKEVELEQFDDITCLYNCVKHNGIDVLKSQIMKYIFILPYGYRPSEQSHVSRLTFLYNSLINTNNKLNEFMQNRSYMKLREILYTYRDVVNLIETIFVGNEDITRSTGIDNYKSISDTITGKQGLMRNRMQGCRIDYSGRTVISEDPTMPIDTIGVPRKMMKVLAEPVIIRDLRSGKLDTPEYNFSQEVADKNLSKFANNPNEKYLECTYDDIFDMWMKKEDRYVVIGRQPTLFYLGMRAFKVEVTNTNTIVLSPLVVMPFNADFDGDQMHINIPVTKAGEKDIKELMSFKNNLFYPKNGSIIITTRHEIIFGLYTCSCAKPTGTSCNISDFSKVYDGVCKQEIDISDVVSGESAGRVALAYALYGTSARLENIANFGTEGIKAGKINELLLNAYNVSTDGFLDAVNRLVKLGFSVAKIYPPNISTVIDSEIKDKVSAELDKFNQDIDRRRTLIDIGLEIEDELTTYFDDRYKKLNDDVKNILKGLGEDNGYMQMYLSGSKGDMNNISQVFGFKGQVQRGNGTGFNAIVEGAYSDQLTGLEHFITAYGSRRGIVEKTLNTADHGYLSRQLEHAGSLVSIQAEDCGTNKYLKFYMKDIVPFLDEGVISKQGILPANLRNEQFYKTDEYATQRDAAVSYLVNILVGRRCFSTKENKLVSIETEKQADAFIRQEWHVPTIDTADSFNYIYEDENGLVYPGKNPVLMRSPIYCDNSCCGECYGRDIAKYGIYVGNSHKKIINDAPKVGRGVGFIAAQSIGEPGTQMTMKNFQKGGVVTGANLTSAFDLIKDYFELSDLTKKKDPRNVAICDHVAPAPAKVITQNLNNGTKRVRLELFESSDESEEKIAEYKAAITSWNKAQITVNVDTKLKAYVEKGESIQVYQGNLDIKEILKISGYDEAVKYLTLHLYDIFKDQDVNFKHFEIITSAMTIYYAHKDLLLKDGNVIKAGTTFTKQLANRLAKYEYDMSFISKTLVGLKELPKYKYDVIESILMENMDTYMPRSIFMSGFDSMTNPITRASFGLNIGIGADVED